MLQFSDNSCKNLPIQTWLTRVAPDFFQIGTTSKKQDGRTKMLLQLLSKNQHKKF